MTTIPSGDRLSLTAIGHVSDQAKWRTESMRAHKSPRLLVFTKGQGRLTISGKVRGFGPNNVIFLPRNTLYGVEMGPTAFGNVVTIPAAMEGDWPDEVTHLRLRDVGTIKELQTNLDQLERELKSPASSAERAALYRLGLLAIFVSRQIELEAETTGDETAADRLVAAYTDLIARNYKSHMGVADYAAQLGVTPTHLTRCCNRTCGKSALRLLNDRVMFEARILLRNTRTPISGIAQSLGFNSAAYFTRSFQSTTGMTPSAFRARGPVQIA